jgi:hypothetical protein
MAGCEAGADRLRGAWSCRVIEVQRRLQDFVETGIGTATLEGVAGYTYRLMGLTVDRWDTSVGELLQ